MIERLNLQHLIYLEALITEGHVTRAAERMGIGQPAMSTALAKLRATLKDPLLVQTSTGMQPTLRAVELVKRFRAMADLLEGREEGEESFHAASATTRFRIMASDGISRLVLPELMAIAGEIAPHMRFTVSPGDLRRAREYLRDGDIDLALAFIRQPPPDLHQTVLYPQRLVCIAHAGHPDLGQDLALAQFVALPHVTWGAAPVPYASMELMVDEALERLGHVRHVALQVSSIMLLPQIVAKNRLLAVVPEGLALSAQRHLPIRLLDLPFKVDSVDISMLWHDRLHNSVSHKWLRGVLRDIGVKLAPASPC